MNFAIHNDTLFLSKHKLIDYSMMLIIDQKNKLIRVGILDYLGSYTLTKQMEGRFKKYVSGIDPTVVRPKFYKNRFRIYMSKYFMPVKVLRG